MDRRRGRLRESYLEDASNDGIVMLINLNKDSADAVADSANLCTSVLAEIAAIEDAGLADALVSTFNDYKLRQGHRTKAGPPSFQSVRCRPLVVSPINAIFPRTIKRHTSYIHNPRSLLHIVLLVEENNIERERDRGPLTAHC